ncbi:gluconeogenesis factor YvcK family protein [Dermacoccaceae bacterium W4C1]
MTRRPHVVALGGGHGLYAALQSWQHVTDRITAVVTVADDGGSSGRLRQEYDILPPGDLRMALAALCSETEWGIQWRDALQHRFPGDGPTGGHALGNLIIASLWDLLGEPVAGLDLVGRLLGARGRVLPMAVEPVRISGMVRGHDPQRPDELVEVLGQVQLATSPGQVTEVRLQPDPPMSCVEAVQAVHDADVVNLGPGSWFTSVMPHLLVPELREALVFTRARRILTMNVTLNGGESEGLSPAQHLQALRMHAPDLHLDVVLVDPSAVEAGETEEELRSAAHAMGADLVLAEVADPDLSGTHDTLRLAAAYRDLLSG